MLHPFIEHKCGQRIAWREAPGALFTYGPPRTIRGLLERYCAERCPRCDGWIPREECGLHPDWTGGYFRKVSRVVWWKPWTWGEWVPVIEVEEQEEE